MGKVMKGKSKHILVLSGLCFVLFFAAFTGIASATEYHVYNGDSVQTVIDSASAGDTIYVHNYSGTYAPFDVNKQLYMIGVDMPTVDGGGSASPITISVDGCTVKGFRVIGGDPYLWGYGGIEVTSHNNIIERNLIESNGGNGIDLPQESSYNQIINNTIRNNGGPGIRYPDHCTIVGNTFSNNYDGWALAFGYDNLVYHNNFYGKVHEYSGDVWYNATLQEGNWWASNTGCVDNNNDGICDDSYPVPGDGGGGEDLYPLVEPWPTGGPTGDDTTPPASITNLHNVTYERTYIKWEWTDPADADLSHVIVYLNGVFKRNVLKGTQFYNATGLSPDTEYTLSTRTVDTAGNINHTWVNHTARTAPEPTYWNLLYFNPDNSTVSGYHQSIDVDIMAYVNESNPITATDVNFTFDPNCVNITNWVNNSEVWKGGSTCTLWSVPLGYVHITTSVGENPAVNGTLKIGTITLQCNSTACCESYLNFTNSSFVKEGGGLVYPTLDNGTFSCNDTAPPASITDLTNTTGNFWINWTWTNPTDADFSHTMVYIDGVFVTNTSSNYYNGTYSAHATRTISTRTVDTAGNINSTWVNQTTTIPNNVPVLEAIGDKMVDEGQALTIDVNASDLDSDTLTYSCNRTDLFTDFDSATGIGSWTPGYDDAGVYYVDFGVSDGEGGVDNETVKITVNDVTLPAPSIISYAPPTPVSDDEGATRTFNISVDQTVNVRWLINGTVVQTNESVTEASYTNTSAVAGYWNVSAVATNENGTAMQTWWWSVNYTAGICGEVNGDGEVTGYDDTVLCLYIGKVPGWELNCG